MYEATYAPNLNLNKPNISVNNDVFFISNIGWIMLQLSVDHPSLFCAKSRKAFQDVSKFKSLSPKDPAAGS